MKNSRTQSSPSTLTRKAQAIVLRQHLETFFQAQAKATEALKAINAIALCENEGNPFPCALQGTRSVIGLSVPHRTYGQGISDAQFVDDDEKHLDNLLTEARQALDASGFWASA
jgi:hypothetical protein